MINLKDLKPPSGKTVPIGAIFSIPLSILFLTVGITNSNTIGISLIMTFLFVYLTWRSIHYSQFTFQRIGIVPTSLPDITFYSYLMSIKDKISTFADVKKWDALALSEFNKLSEFTVSLAHVTASLDEKTIELKNGSKLKAIHYWLFPPLIFFRNTAPFRAIKKEKKRLLRLKNAINELASTLEDYANKTPNSKSEVREITGQIDNEKREIGLQVAELTNKRKMVTVSGRKKKTTINRTSFSSEMRSNQLRLANNQINDQYH